MYPTCSRFHITLRDTIAARCARSGLDNCSCVYTKVTRKCFIRIGNFFFNYRTSLSSLIVSARLPRERAPRQRVCSRDITTKNSIDSIFPKWSKVHLKVMAVSPGCKVSYPYLGQFLVYKKTSFCLIYSMY